MKRPLFSLGVLLILSLIVIGCGNGNSTSPPPNPAGEVNTPVAPSDTKPSESVMPEVTVSTTGGTNHPAQKVVMDFLMELMRGNAQGVVALLSPLAQQEYAKGNSFPFKPEVFEQVEFHITGSDLVNENDPYYYGVRADMVMVNSTNKPVPTVWGVRRIGLDEYRVANMMYYDDEIQDFIPVDFEAPGRSAGVLLDAPAQQATNPMPQYNPPGQNNWQPMMQSNPQQMAQPYVPNLH